MSAAETTAHARYRADELLAFAAALLARRGVFAGVSLEGASIRPDKEANEFHALPPFIREHHARPVQAWGRKAPSSGTSASWATVLASIGIAIEGLQHLGRNAAL